MPTVGHLTFSDEPAIANELNPIAQRIAANLADRIGDVTIKVKPRGEMKRYRDPRPGDGPNDGRARGYWHEGKRTIDLADDLFAPGEPLAETLGHETMHVLFSDWITREQKAQILPLITPTPDGFGDQSIDDREVGYPASPEECCAVWGSAAIYAFDPPAYVGLYKRSIAKSQLPTLRQILLASNEVIIPDACDQIRARNKVLEARITEISADLDALLANLDDTAKKAKPIP